MCHDKSILIKDAFYSLKLETSLFDDPNPDLEWQRQHIVATFCDDNMATNWEGILEENTSEEFLVDLYNYAKQNLIKLHLFISSPFATEFKRSVETPRISFVANIGGKYIPDIVSVSLNILARVDGTLHGIQFCKSGRNHLLRWTIICNSHWTQE